MQIENKTPWDTEGLTALVTAMSDSLPNLEKVTFINQRPQPGVKRGNQTIYGGSEPYDWQKPNQDRTYIKELCLELLTPKRVKTRTSPLDRLAFAKDLEAHQVPLPVSVIENIVHALHAATKTYPNTNRWERRPHINGSCSCNKDLPETPIIAGDTKARTQPPVTLAQLQRKLYYAEKQVERSQKDLDDATAKADRLRKRIKTKKERDAKEQAKLDRIAAKAKKTDDLTASLVGGERNTP
jgi:hypothetical protein